MVRTLINSHFNQMTLISFLLVKLYFELIFKLECVKPVNNPNLTKI